MLALAVAGFITRRALAPVLWRHLTHRPARGVAAPEAGEPLPGAEQASGPPQAVAGAPQTEAPPAPAVRGAAPSATAAPTGENLSERDRRELDAVLKRKTR